MSFCLTDDGRCAIKSFRQESRERWEAKETQLLYTPLRELSYQEGLIEMIIRTAN